MNSNQSEETQQQNAEEDVKKSDSSSDGSVKSQSNAKRIYPGINWIVTWLVLIGVIVFINYAAGKIEDRVPVLDQAFRNLITFLGTLGTLFTVFLWFAFFSDNANRIVRQSLFWGYIAFEIGLAFVLVRYVEFDADLFPIGWKTEAKFDNQTADATVDLTTETPEDFPQFLGPRRDGKLPEIFFSYDWEKDKPVQVWKKPVGAGHSGFATRNGFAVTMEQRGDQEMTTCYEIASGDLMWTYGVETRHDTLFGKLGPRSTPTIFGGKVYSLGAHGHLACLDGSNGKPIWTKDLLKEFGTSVEQESNTVTWGRSASPLVFGDKVVVPAGGPPGGPFVSLVATIATQGMKSGEAEKRKLAILRQS